MTRIPSLFYSLVIFIVAFCTCLHTSAQWKQETNGIYGGSVSQFTSVGSTLFLASNLGGVFRSTDNGVTWTKVSAGIPNVNLVNCVSIGARVFVATFDRLYYSDDSGETWSPTTTLPGSIRALLVKGTTLLAGINDKGFYFSNDSGVTWTPSNTGLTNLSIECLHVSGSNIYAGTWNSGTPFLSTDNGATWTEIKNGLPNFSVSSITSLGTEVFMSTALGAIYKTNDNGANWNFVTTLSSVGSVYLLTIGSSIYASTFDHGIRISDDGGNTWRSPVSGLPSLAYDVGGRNPFFQFGPRIFATVHPGAVYVTSDNGATWSRTNTGLTSTSVTTILVDGAQTWAASNDGVFTSSDNGATWLQTSLEYPFGDQNSLYEKNGKLFIGGNDPWGTGISPVFISPDGGATWSNRPINTGTANSEQITCFESIGSNIYASTTNLSTTGTAKVFLTTNDGNTWSNITNTLSSKRISSMATNGSTLFVGTLDAGIFSTQNNGTNWTQSLPTENIVRLHQDAGLIYAASYAGGLYISPDNGSTWSKKTIPGGQLFEVLAQDGKIFAVSGNGIHLSVDGGDTWRNINGNLPTQLAYALAISGTRMLASSGLSNGLWSAALDMLTLLPQSITFGSLSPVTFGAGPITLSATASSGLPVTFTSSNANVATVSGNVVTITGAGTTTITALQVGNTTYATAAAVDQTLTVNKAAQTITLNATTLDLSAGTINLAPMSSANLVITYTSSNTAVASVTGNALKVISPGSTTITATQAGNANYQPVSTTAVFTVNKAEQQILFNEFTTTRISAAAIPLTATSSSGLAITYTSSNTQVATVDSNMLNIVGYGTTTITASQSGNGIYNPATDVTHILEVERDAIEVFNVVTPNNDGAHDFLKIKFIEQYSNFVYLYDRWGNAVFETSGYDNDEPLKRFNGTANVGDTHALNDGTYFYVIDLGLSKKVTGFFELMR
ncbi:MAG TPA: gliding motility-associated C-terminal domain-containing protein [Cyclobacteriaceae bacterium]|nr:gliding motility-associated C-terminal domain-containing protein [Cyclobacteriaceae bacterium]